MSFRWRLSILLVDDDEATCTATTSMLEHLGHRVTGETHSLTALRTFSDEPDRFDLAILENAMPGLTGIDLAQRFKRIRPGFPVLLYAGDTDRPSSEQIEAAGIWRVISKPLTAKKLQKVIGEAPKG